MFGNSWWPGFVDHTSAGGVGTRDTLLWTITTLDMLAFTNSFFENSDTVQHTVVLEYSSLLTPVGFAQIVRVDVGAGNSQCLLPVEVGVITESRVAVPLIFHGPCTVQLRDLTNVVTNDVRFGARWMQRRMGSRQKTVTPAIVTV